MISAMPLPSPSSPSSSLFLLLLLLLFCVPFFLCQGRASDNHDGLGMPIGEYPGVNPVAWLKSAVLFRIIAYMDLSFPAGFIFHIKLIIFNLDDIHGQALGILTGRPGLVDTAQKTASNHKKTPDKQKDMHTSSVL
jgi:hypothetical protein